jgi:2-polyprenyl-3-methyl-5-hydroxy-6-metoxy-1,4-benzoquinol methylase
VSRPEAGAAPHPSSSLVTARRASCPWCGARERTTLCDHPYDQEPLRSALKDPVPEPGLRFTVHECRRCRTLYQETVYREEATALYYESWPFEETPLEYTLFYVQELLMVLGHFDRPAANIRVLDYGMGWGRFCQVATTMGFDAVGYDLNRNMREHGRSRSLRVVDRIEDIEAGSMDFINLEQVLEHVAAPRELIERLSMRLKPGGIMKISVPIRPLGVVANLRGVARMTPAQVRSRLMDIWPLIHVNCFNRGALKAVLADTLRYRRIHLNSLFLVLRRGLLSRVFGRAIYKNYAPRVNYLFFIKR